METPIYAEKQVMKFRWLLTAAGVAVMVLGAWQTWRAEPISAIAMLIFAGIFVVILRGFTQFSTVVTPTELRFGFPLFRKRFLLTTLEVGDVQRITLLAGIGIHFWGGKWVYNARYGSGVNLKHGRFRYLIGSDQPERLQSTLLQLVPRIPVSP